MRRTRSRALPALAVAAALALAGCSFQGGVDEDAAAPTPGTSVATAPAVPSPSATSTSPPTDDVVPPATSSPDASPSAPSGSDGAGSGDTGSDASGSGGSNSDGTSSTGSGSDSAGSDGSSGGAAPAPTATSGGGGQDAGTGTGAGTTSGGSGGETGGGPSSDGLQEIRFPAGQTTTTVRGQAPASQGPQYVFAASAGQEASLSVSSDGDEVGFDLVAPDGAPLKTTMSSATSGTWTLPADGDYVVGLASPDAGVPYALTLTIR